MLRFRDNAIEEEWAWAVAGHAIEVRLPGGYSKTIL
jgi:hypothetical protein